MDVMPSPLACVPVLYRSSCVLSDLISMFVNWGMDVMEAVGYPGLAFIVFFETVVLVIPSEAVLPAAGFLASDGRLHPVLAILAATIGSLAGALLFYGFGAWFGEARVRMVVRRWGRWIGIKQRDVDLAQAWFNRHGARAVVICRVIPVLKSLISIPAGVQRMPLGGFLLWTLVGSIVANSALIGAGWILGDNWHVVEDYTKPLTYLVIAAALLAAGWWIWNRIIGPARMSG